jgi:hypothetical protein
VTDTDTSGDVDPFLPEDPPVIVEQASADEDTDGYPSWLPDGFHVEIRTLVSNDENSVVLGPFTSVDEAITVSASFPTVDRIEVMHAVVRDTPTPDPFDEVPDEIDVDLLGHDDPDV